MCLVCFVPMYLVCTVRIFRGGIAPRRQLIAPGRQLMSRRPPPYQRPGWRASAGGVRAGRCGSKSTRLPRRDRTRLESAHVAPHGARRVVAIATCPERRDSHCDES
jgi:hypothetical protein